MANELNKYNIPFSPPDITDLEIEEVVDTLKSGWITTGPKTKLFEKQIAEYLGTDKAVCLNSQTACAELCLRLLDIGPNDEVITCAYTYTASASVIQHVGAKIVLVDCQKDSLEMDYSGLEKAITKNTKAIIPVDIAGIPCDYEKIFDIVNKKKDIFVPKNDIQKLIGRIAVIADTAHSFGARRKFNGTWKKCGQIADFSNFSFHAVKNLTTGEGGAMTWNIPGANSEEIYHQIQLFSLHGQSKDALAKTKLGAWEYDIVGPWYKCNMTDIMASIGIAQLKRYDSLLDYRKELIEMYDSVLSDTNVTPLKHYTDNYSSSGHLYITRVNNIDEAQRQQIIDQMAQRGISTNVHYKPLPMFTAYKNMGFSIKDYPNAYNMYKNEITLPLHTKLTKEEARYVIESYKDIIKEYK